MHAIIGQRKKIIRKRKGQRLTNVMSRLKRGPASRALQVGLSQKCLFSSNPNTQKYHSISWKNVTRFYRQIVLYVTGINSYNKHNEWVKAFISSYFKGSKYLCAFAVCNDLSSKVPLLIFVIFINEVLDFLIAKKNKLASWNLDSFCLGILEKQLDNIFVSKLASFQECIPTVISYCIKINVSTWLLQK